MQRSQGQALLRLAARPDGSLTFRLPTILRWASEPKTWTLFHNLFDQAPHAGTIPIAEGRRLP